MFARPLFFVIAFSFFLLGCDAAASLPFGKPSTNAPRNTSDIIAFWEACDEREQKIDAWEEQEKEKLEDAWMDGKRGLLQSGAKSLKVGEEAEEMRRELMENCHKADTSWDAPPDLPGSPDPTEKGSCVDEQGEDTLESIIDADGAVFPTYWLSGTLTDSYGGGSKSSCGVSIRVSPQEAPDGAWAGYVWARPSGGRVRVSKTRQDGEYLYLEGWVRP